MTHIDFIIGFIMLMSAVFMIMYFVSSSISNNMNDISTSDVKESAIALESYLFKIESGNSLAVGARSIQAVIEDINGTDHSEYSTVVIMPKVKNARVYDYFWNETFSTSTNLSDETSLSFTLNFNANEKKRLSIVYYGDDVESLSYYDSDGETAMKALPGEEIMVVTQERCNDLNEVSYDDFKKGIDFSHQFRLEIDNCVYGSSPPSTTSIFVRRIPVIFEKVDGSLSSGFARLMIW